MSVTMTTGHGLFGSATGSTFKSPLWMFERKVEAGIAATKRPVASNCSRSATETVSTIALGIFLPMAANASSTRHQFQLLAGKIQGASASSARLILRRLPKGLLRRQPPANVRRTAFRHREPLRIQTHRTLHGRARESNRACAHAVPGIRADGGSLPARPESAPAEIDGTIRR